MNCQCRQIVEIIMFQMNGWLVRAPELQHHHRCMCVVMDVRVCVCLRCVPSSSYRFQSVTSLLHAKVLPFSRVQYSCRPLHSKRVLVLITVYD